MIVMDLIKKVIKDVVTGIDGQSYDIARVMGVIGVVFFLGMTCWNVFHKDLPFEYVNWGLGFGSVVGGMCAAIKIKESTEPNKDD